MRSIIVGTTAQRQQLRERLDELGDDLRVVAEFESLFAARVSGISADVILLLPASHARDAGDASDPADVDDDERPGVESLTPRELEVLDLVAMGLSNKAIADRLGISDQTVKFHLASITGKLGAANRTDAVRLAVRRGLITL